VQLLTAPTVPASAEVDWEEVERIVFAGRVEALVLRALPPNTPAAFRERLQTRARKVAFSGLRALRERDQLMAALQESGVERAVLLKGSVLGWLLYPDPLLRSMNDLDLLVSPKDMDTCRDTLCRLGYIENDLFPKRSASRDHYHERLYYRELVPKRVRQIVELHTGFAQDFRHDIPYSQLLERALLFPEGGPGAYRLEDTDQLIHLCVHMAREQFLGPLKHLLDIHHWVQQDRVDWPSLIQRSAGFQTATAVSESLRLAQLIFQTRVPAAVVRALRPSWTRRRFLQWWHQPRAESLLRFSVSMRTAQAVAMLPLLDTHTQRLRCLWGYGSLRARDWWGTVRTA